MDNSLPTCFNYAPESYFGEFCDNEWSPAEQHTLHEQRMETYLDDEETPFSRTVRYGEGYFDSMSIERALAEADGLEAGLKFLRKLTENGATTDQDFLDGFMCREMDAKGYDWAELKNSEGLLDGGFIGAMHLDDTIIPDPKRSTPRYFYGCSPYTADMDLEDTCTMASIETDVRDTIVVDPQPGSDYLGAAPAPTHGLGNLPPPKRDDLQSASSNKQSMDDPFDRATTQVRHTSLGTVLDDSKLSNVHNKTRGDRYRIQRASQQPNSNRSASPGHESLPLSLSLIQRGVLSLRRVESGSKKDYDRFLKVVPGLRKAFPSPEVWTRKGKDTWARILKGELKTRITLPEILAFTSLSFVISELLIDEGRMRPDHLLADIIHFRDSLEPEDREVFSLLALLIWPLPGMADRLKYAKDELGSPLPTASRDISQSAIEIASMTEKHIDFSQFLRFSDEEATSGVDINLKENEESARDEGCIDPRLLLTEKDVLGDVPLCHNQQFPLPLGSLSPASPKQPSLTTRGKTAQDHQWHIPSRLNNNLPQGDLRRTMMFLSIRYFLEKGAGEFFFVLSGRGKTVTHCWDDFPSPVERSKSERKLRKAFFEPLKNRLRSAPKFRVLVSVAKHFVILGSLQTRAEVLGYLLTVSKVRAQRTYLHMVYLVLTRVTQDLFGHCAERFQFERLVTNVFTGAEDSTNVEKLPAYCRPAPSPKFRGKRKTTDRPFGVLKVQM